MKVTQESCNRIAEKILLEDEITRDVLRPFVESTIHTTIRFEKDFQRILGRESANEVTHDR
jgi:hypothetical protein